MCQHQKSKFLNPLLVMLVVLSSAWGQQIPAGGESFISAGAFAGASFYSQAGVASREWVSQPDAAWRVRILTRADDAWAAELSMRNALPAAMGEVALVTFRMRSTESTREDNETWCTFYAQYPDENWSKDALVVVSAGTEWHTFYIPIQFSRAVGINKMQFVFGFGADPGVLEIADFQVLYYGTAVAFEDLPRTSFGYAGSEPDAAWRLAAAERIEQYRRGDFTLRIVDRSGNPVTDASIEVVQRNHAFEFSSAIAFWRLLEDSPDNLQYRETFRQLFNAGGNENALKAPPWQGDWGSSRYGRQVALDGLRWMRANGLRSRGHAMVWPGLDNLPQSVTDLIGTAGQDSIPGLVLDHIEDIATATRGFVTEWDVLNEPVSNHLLMDLFGEEIIDDWFNQAATHVEPGTPLYLNDYSLLSGGGRNLTKISTIYTLILSLQARGVPISGLGLQSHFGSDLTSPDRLLEILDQFATLGLRLRITEFDIDMVDRELQAQYLKDFLTIVYSHPAVAGFQMWGFWEGAHWRPEAALYDIDWTPRPAAEAFRQLVWEEWTTETAGSTNASGEFSFRGTFGEYAVTIQVDDKSFVHTVHLEKDGTVMIVPLLADEAFLLPQLRLSAPAVPQLSWNSRSGDYQRLERSHDLLDWKKEAEFLDGPEGPVSVMADGFDPDAQATFYRLVGE